MDFISNQEPQIQEMLNTLQIASIEELFSAIPSQIMRKAPSFDDGLSEYEGIRLMEKLAAKNSYPLFENYLGAGSYEHHIPALVQAICSKSEFLTSYTPYQAEASQGMLQVIFEFQSAICALTGMDAANASLYDGASACAEALLMALRLKKGCKKVLIAESLHPHYRAVIDQYLLSLDVERVTIPFLLDGQLDVPFLLKELETETAAALFAYPNFLGVVEDLRPIFQIVKEKGAHAILCANPLALGLYQSPAELGADIAVGDCQPFGIPMQFGGPYAGYIACREELVRQLPGRIVGGTVDGEGRRGFVLTLQAREQHIRREKATSNICTNQALSALAALVGMLWYGKEGIKELSLMNYQKAAYLKEHLSSIPGLSTLATPFFNEFVVHFEKPIEKVIATFRSHYIEPGVNLGRFFPRLSGSLLIAVTEIKTKEQLDRYIEAARKI